MYSNNIRFLCVYACVDSSFVPPLVYAVLGSSRDLAVGPVSIASLLLGSMLRQEVSPTQEPLLFLQLAFTCTFFAGIFQASLGILRWPTHPFTSFQAISLHITNFTHGLVIFLTPQSGSCRLGFVIDFLSKATLVGFMAGAAVIVSLQQLKSLLGIEHFTKQMGLVSVLSSVFHRKDEVLLLKFPTLSLFHSFQSSLHVFETSF